MLDGKLIYAIDRFSSDIDKNYAFDPDIPYEPEFQNDASLKSGDYSGAFRSPQRSETPAGNLYRYEAGSEVANSQESGINRNLRFSHNSQVFSGRTSWNSGYPFGIDDDNQRRMGGIVSQRSDADTHDFHASSLRSSGSESSNRMDLNQEEPANDERY
mmetsp:Transcript_14009/g.15466  ORF Transcript_14009/g.15466 Transcript_14009/m.15466 type:complete len:158 (+) Transcript_14009:1-474(+)